MANEVSTVDWSEIDEAAEQERVKAELTHPNFKSWLKGLLHETELTVTFFKTSGEERTMRCTLDDSKIPSDKQPKGTSTKKVSDSTISVYDLDKEDWRSFRFESIKEFDFDLPEDSEYPPSPAPVYFDDEGNEVEAPPDIFEEEDDGVTDVEYTERKTIQ